MSNTPTVDEISKRKQALQRKLQHLVDTEIINFQLENKVSISDVYFDFTSVFTAGEPARVILTDVDITIEI